MSIQNTQVLIDWYIRTVNNTEANPKEKLLIAATHGRNFTLVDISQLNIIQRIWNRLFGTYSLKTVVNRSRNIFLNPPKGSDLDKLNKVISLLNTKIKKHNSHIFRFNIPEILIPPPLQNPVLDSSSPKLSSNDCIQSCTPSPNTFSPDFIRNLDNIKIKNQEELKAVLYCTFTEIAFARSYKPTDEDVALISKYPQITSLNLSHSKITDVGLADIAKLSNLTSLDLSLCEKITDAAAPDIAKLSNLTYLNLSYCTKITDAGLADIAKLSNLTSLNLSWCNKITDAAAPHIAKLSNLTSLNLSLCEKITDGAAPDIAKLSNLTSLNLSLCEKITDAAAPDIAKLSNLTYLDLSGCQITDAAAPHIAKLLNLTYLDLSLCEEITDAAAPHIAELLNLTYLDLSLCEKITNDSTLIIKTLSKLTFLNVSNTKVSLSAIAQLKKKFPSLSLIYEIEET